MSTERPIAEDDLHAYVDGALEGTRMRAVEAYLAVHPDVAERVATYAAQRSGLRAALAPIAAEPVPSGLSLVSLLAARRRPRAVPWGAAAAALVCLAIGGGIGWISRGATDLASNVSALNGLAPNSLAALGREAAITYEVFAPDKARPVEIRAAEQDQLVRWVSNRLHHQIRVPDLASAGYHFMGGRLIATPHGPAGMYMYDDDRGVRLAVLVRPMAIEHGGAMVAHDDGPVAGFSWAEGGIGYSLVASSPSRVLQPLADEVRRQMDKPV